MQVELNDQVGVCREWLRDAVRKKARRHPRHPAAKARHASSTQTRKCAVGVARFVRVCGTRKEQRVVDDLARARLEVDGGHPRVVTAIEWKHDVAVEIGAVS